MDRRHQTRLTIQEAKGLIGGAAPKVVASLASKGALDRIGRGIYLVRPLRAVGRRWGISAFVAVEQSLVERPHYIGGLAVLSIHRLTEQTHSSVIDVFITGRKEPLVLANAKIRFHSEPSNDLLVGQTSFLVEQVAVRISDPERTLVDALNYPSAFGGVAQGVRAVDRAIDRVKPDRLVTYALQLSAMSSLQRLAVLMERHNAPARQLSRLAARIRDTENVPAMIPGLRKGRVNPRWHISENDIRANGSAVTT